MNATHTNTFEESQQQLAAGVLKQAAQDLQRFHGAATTIERELYFDAYRWVMSNDCRSPFSFLSVCQALELVPQTVRQELVVVKLKTVSRIEHHCCFAVFHRQQCPLCLRSHLEAQRVDHRPFRLSPQLRAP
jgi:hypothetical protein